MPRPKKKTTGAASFCVPRAAIEALIDHQASAYEICTYLTLACFTDPTGCYSTASVHAASTYTGANKARLAKAIARLKTITAKRSTSTPAPAPRGRRALPPPPQDLGPILYDRAGWEQVTGEVLPVGATPQTTVQHVLPDFNEPLAERVWFGSNLVRGVGGFDRPLKALKNAGEEAARLLLLLYAAHDMDLWGGVDPHRGPWVHYEPADFNYPPKPFNERPYSEPIYGGQILRWTRAGTVSSGDFGKVWRAPGSDWWTAHTKAGGPMWRAIEALEAIGLIYEMVLVLNRRGEAKTFASGAEHYAVPANAEPLYELAARTRHGWQPAGEEGLADATAATVEHLRYPVNPHGVPGRDTYAALVPTGHGAMIAGVYRLRFRPSNPKNAGVRNAWARIHQGNRDGFALIQAARAAHKLPELPSRTEDLQKEAPKREARTRKTAGNRPKIARSRERTLQ